jgi:hypothetical protein
MPFTYSDESYMQYVQLILSLLICALLQTILGEAPHYTVTSSSLMVKYSPQHLLPASTIFFLQSARPMVASVKFNTCNPFSYLAPIPPKILF